MKGSKPFKQAVFIRRWPKHLSQLLGHQCWCLAQRIIDPTHVLALAPWVAQQQIDFFLFLIAHPISQGSKVLKEAR